jgi:hypothetical protein
MRARSKALLGCLLVLLAAGCGKRPPRELPFPAFDPRAPFPELAGGEEPAAPAKKASDFDRALAPATDATLREEPHQSMPLGNGLLGDLPGDSGAWSWSADRRLTLAVHRGAAGVDALIWAEAFTPRMATGPAAETRRFQREIVPGEMDDLPDLESYLGLFRHDRGRRLARDTGLDPLQALNLLELARTRTAGLGLGFRSSGEDSSGVRRWAGRNPRGVTVRLDRSAGTWGRQRPFPAELARGLGGLGKTAPELKPVADWIAQSAGWEEPGAPSGGPAYLLTGSATVEHEAVGAHLAILCARVPQCPVAKDLSAFLGSLQIADLARLQRLQGSSAGDPSDLARSAGLRVLPSALVKPE